MVAIHSDYSQTSPSAVSYIYQANKVISTKDWGQIDMGNISREELDAKLGRNKAEIDAIASSMRQEMAGFREFQAQQFAAMNASIGEIKAQISGVTGEITGLKGQIDGLKTTSSTVQWMVGAILALLAVLLAYPPIQRYLDTNQQQATSQLVTPHKAAQAPATVQPK